MDYQHKLNMTIKAQRLRQLIIWVCFMSMDLEFKKVQKEHLTTFCRQPRPAMDQLKTKLEIATLVVMEFL